MTTKLQDAAQAILDELAERYDGAPDSGVLWMGQHMADLEAALKNYSPDAELLVNLGRVKNAAIAAGIPIDGNNVYCDRQSIDKRSCIVTNWRASLLISGTPRYIYGGEAETIEEAIAKCIAAVKADMGLCKICGGRMDGPCKHSHNSPTEPDEVPA